MFVFLLSSSHLAFVPINVLERKGLRKNLVMKEIKNCCLVSSEPLTASKQHNPNRIYIFPPSCFSVPQRLHKITCFSLQIKSKLFGKCAGIGVHMQALFKSSVGGASCIPCASDSEKSTMEFALIINYPMSPIRACRISFS